MIEDSFITQNTHQASLPLYAINNLICGGHHIDVTNALLHTAELSLALGNKLRTCDDNDYQVNDFGDDRHAIQAIRDVFEGERYGIGYEVCEQIERYIEEASGMIDNCLGKIATQNLIKQVCQN